MRTVITEEEYDRMTSGLGSPGVCIGCGMVEEYAECEPDASEYECPECGENKLYGLEKAMMMGKVYILQGNK